MLFGEGPIELLTYLYLILWFLLQCAQLVERAPLLEVNELQIAYKALGGFDGL
jgi:hypothetical protein